MDRERFLELVAACLSDEADAEAQRAVLDAAQASPELAALLAEQVRLDAALRAHQHEVDPFVARFHERITVKGRSAQFSTAARARFERERARARWWSRRLWPLAVALVVLLAMLLAPWPRGAAPTSAAVAVVVLADAGAEMEVSGHWSAAVVGARLDTGCAFRATGGARLVVRLADGATVAARGDAAWTLTAARVRLDAGAIDIARPQASPALAAATPAWDVSILAPRCSLATGGGGDRVEPDGGEARVARVADGAIARAGGGEAVAADDDGRPVRRPRRVANHLLALWLFDGGHGGTVPAAVGGPALDLALGDPSHATWLPRGLRVDPAAGIASVGTLDLGAEAATHAIAFECWGVVEPGDRVGLNLVETRSSPSASMAATAASLVPDRLCHLVVEMAFENGRTVVRTWRDGELAEDWRDVGDASLLKRNLAAPERVLLATVNRNATGPAPAVELRLVAIHAGMLGPDGVRANHDAGLPQSAALLSPRSP